MDQSNPAWGRRTSEVRGGVAFPTDSKVYKSTRDGGMVVKLYVMEPNGHPAGSTSVCCGADVRDILSDNLVFSDRIPKPTQNLSDDLTMEDFEAHQKKMEEWGANYYPQHAKPYRKGDTYGRFISAPLVACITLGSTGWSGYADSSGYWGCTVDDLTYEGRKVYKAIQALYPHAELHLLTFLDT